MSKLLYHSRITKVRFQLTGTAAAKADSYCKVMTYDLVRNGLPYPGGVNDAHLGTIGHEYRCMTCFNTKAKCLGHEGHIDLNYPVINPLALGEMRKWIKLICFKCGHPVIDESIYAKFPKSKRLDEASKLARSSARKCHYCKESHPIVKKDPREPMALLAEWFEEKSKIAEERILPHRLKEIFERVSDETVIKLGRAPQSGPRNFTLSSIKVPPTTIRPDVKKLGGGRSTNDDLTTMLQIIIKKNEAIPSVLPAIIEPKVEKSILELSSAYYEFVKAGGEGSMASLALRLRGKAGRFRKTQLGKRVRNMCRSTIVGDPTLKIDEVGLPQVFARTIQMEEVVQEFNKRRLMTYINNGRAKYPGCTKIIKRGTGATYNIEAIGKDIEIENGDIIQRDIINGDPVNFNRQPSLLPSNITTMKVVVHEDPMNLTLGMNVLATPLFNADFDGDQMNIIAATSIATRNEIAELSSAPNWLISHTTSSPAIGQVDDSIIGLAELTRNGVEYDKYHAMFLFKNTTYIPSFTNRDRLTGRDVISALLEETPINFTRMAEFYKPHLAQWMRYDPDEIRVKVDHGKLVSGVLDKKSIAKGANGGLYHIIASDYGNAKALEVMFNMQQVAIAHIIFAGYTIGINDLLVPANAKAEIDRIAADLINKSRLLTEKLDNGEIIPPIGKTVEEFYEEQQINALSVYDDFTGPILSSINVNTNNLFKLVMFGSKGKLDNIYNIISAIGQKLINGERIRQKFGFKRTLAYFRRFETNPIARGYIPDSYLGGMTSVGYVFNAMASRFDLISKALSTSVTGEQNRKSIKNLESIIVNNFRWATKGSNIVQMAYGENYIDPRFVERVKFPTVMISDAAFKEKYYRKGFDEEFKRLAEDRAKYREIFLTVEGMNTKELFSDERKMPFDLDRLISDTLREYRGTVTDPAPDDKQLAEMVAEVDKFCESVQYIVINEIQERRRMPIPDFIKNTTWLVIMLIRSYLCSAQLAARGITMPILRIILDKIRMRYSRALVEPGTAVGIIAAQSFSEPLTQYMLDAHHRSAAGGTSKSGMTKTKEVLGAKPLEKLEAPNMIIPVLPEFEHNRAKVQEIANNIEVMKLSRFVVLWQVFFEKYGEIVHPKYRDEITMLSEFNKMNPLLTPPGDLVHWCIRLVLNKTTLILKNMSIELIVTKLRETFPDLYIAYTPENVKQVVLRIYMRNTMFKGHIELDDVKKLKNSIMDTIIRGVDGIINASVIKLMRNRVIKDGPDAGKLAMDDGIFAISTNGVNMFGILSHKYVDALHVQADAIKEMERLFGIEAARQKIVSEQRGIIDVCYHAHYLIYADEMCYTGRVTSIERGGLSTRESGNWLLRIAFSSPIQTIEEAALNAAEDNVMGVSAPLLIGSIPRIGTLYNKVVVDEEFVKKNVKRPDDYIESLI